MHPIIEQDLMRVRISELHRQADRERLARAASRPRHTQQEERRRNFLLGRTACPLVRRVPTSAQRA
jgi:hypothetical protein